MLAIAVGEQCKQHGSTDCERRTVHQPLHAVRKTAARTRGGTSLLTCLYLRADILARVPDGVGGLHLAIFHRKLLPVQLQRGM